MNKIEIRDFLKRLFQKVFLKRNPNSDIHILYKILISYFFDAISVH